MQITKINNKPLTIREYNGQRVLMFKDIDKAHGRPDGTASRAFRSNRQHFIDKVDFFKICSDEIRRNNLFEIPKMARNDIILITESGYLMLAKSFTDDLAWTVQRQLVNCYFRCKEQQPEQLTLEEPNYPKAVLESAGYRYQDKTFNGEPVVTLNDIAFHIGVSPDTARGVLRRYGKYGKDYYKIEGAQIIKFKKQNTGLPHTWNHLILVTKSGFMLLAKYYNLTKNTPQCFLTDNKPVVAEKPKTNKLPSKPTTDEFITALNVMRYIRATSENFKAKNDCMADYYDDKISAAETVTKHIGMMISV